MKIQKRRRREYKTDYANRIRLLRGGFPRIVFRKTNKYIISQYITSKEAKDKVEISANSKELTKYGWPKEGVGSLKSITASYLTGLLMGEKMLKGKQKESIVDLGMNRTIHKTRVYAFLKGLIDAGIPIKCGEKTFPEENRIKGDNLKHKIDFIKIKSEIEKI